MLNIELMQCGLDDTLKEIRSDLESVIGKSYSKRQKDAVIYKTLGAVNTIWNMVQVVEANNDTVSEV